MSKFKKLQIENGDRGKGRSFRKTIQKAIDIDFYNRRRRFKIRSMKRKATI